MSPNARAAIVSFAVLTTLAGAGFLAARGVLNAEPSPVAAAPQDLEEHLRQRGAYLISAIGCNDCHSPHDDKGQLIPGKELSGHPESAPLAQWDPSLFSRNVLMTASPTFTSFAGPWGVSVAGNITPDKETGIGNLTAEALIRSWRTGKHWKYPRDIMPPMPAPAFASLSDDDIRALHAFLMSMPPVKNKAPASIPAPPPLAAK